MGYLQVDQEKSNNIRKSRFLVVLLNINIIAILISFILNFLGAPILKYHYLIHLIITFFAIIAFEFPQILPFIIALLFIEGQGRILWGNDYWTKIIFDGLTMLSIAKVFIDNKKIFNSSGLPKLLIVLITFHFLWYLLEFSNLNSVSYLALFASSKIYIYPILFFLALSQIDFDISQKQFQNTLNFFIFLLILELALTFYQYFMRESLIMQISQNYQQAMKDYTFAGSTYRPFGTTPLPGAISTYFFLTVGFLFLKKDSLTMSILKILLISLTALAIILCQVRSSLIKMVLIILLIQLGELIYYRFRAKSFISIFLIVTIFIFGGKYLINSKLPGEDQGLRYVKDRFTSLGDMEIMKNSRLTIPLFFQIAGEKIMSKPLGLGPGLTGSVGRLSLEQVKESRFLNIDMLWANDNLFITLLIDFGVGAIFYIFLLFYIPIYFFQFLVKFYFSKDFEPYKILLICFSSIVVIIFGCWGAIGITYNPESFIFWFFTAIGFSTIAKYKNRLNITPSTQLS